MISNCLYCNDYVTLVLHLTWYVRLGTLIHSFRQLFNLLTLLLKFLLNLTELSLQVVNVTTTHGFTSQVVIIVIFDERRLSRRQPHNVRC